MKQSLFELFGRSTLDNASVNWKSVLKKQHCPFNDRKCIKIRKSQPDISIGSCTVCYGRSLLPVMICPLRLLERRQIFADCIHLLTLHEPGNALHVVPEISIPGGSIDYFLVSAKKGKAVDFVGIELQTLDTTGTVWPVRERFLHTIGLSNDVASRSSNKSFGMNWKMTAKTILVQLHHKVRTFESISKHLVLVIQDCLLDYMRREFRFDHMSEAKIGHAMHIHTYALEQQGLIRQIELSGRCSTDAAGISTALGLQAEAHVELDAILSNIQKKLSDKTRWTPAWSKRTHR